MTITPHTLRNGGRAQEGKNMKRSSERQVAVASLLSAFAIVLLLFAFVPAAEYTVHETVEVRDAEESTDVIDIIDTATAGQIPISSAAELALVGTGHTDADGRVWSLDETYFLNNDIAMTGTHVPIGTPDDPFTGTFNGNKRTISGIDVNVTAADIIYAGLFGYTDGALIYGLRIDGSFTASIDDPFAGYPDMCIYMGSIAGFARSSTIKDCRNAGSVTSYFLQEEYRSSPLILYTGGLVGWASSSVMEGCHNTGDVVMVSTNYIFTAGIAGIAENTTMDGCTNTGDITASASSIGSVNAGGIAGQYASVDADTTMIGCMNAGNVSAATTYYGRAKAAGIAADLFIYYGNATIIGCTNSGNVSAAAPKHLAVAGGAFAEAQTSEAEIRITDCTNSGNITASAEVGAIAAGLMGSAMLWQGPMAVERCHNAGTVTAGEAMSSILAGVIGTVFTDSPVTVADCCNSGNITAGPAWETYIGGIFGHMLTADLVLANCCSTGELEEAAWTSTHMGGIGGVMSVWESNAYVANCYFIEMNEIGMFGTVDGAVPLTDGDGPGLRSPDQFSGAKPPEKMRTSPEEAGSGDSVYYTGTAVLGDVTLKGWDFGGVWTIAEGSGYPVPIGYIPTSAEGPGGTEEEGVPEEVPDSTGQGTAVISVTVTKGHVSVPVLQIAAAAIFVMLFIGCAFYALRRDE